MALEFGNVTHILVGSQARSDDLARKIGGISPERGISQAQKHNVAWGIPGMGQIAETEALFMCDSEGQHTYDDALKGEERGG